LKLVNKIANPALLTCSNNVVGSLRFFSRHAIGELLGRKGIVIDSVVCLHVIQFTMVTPCCYLKDFLYFLICSGVRISRSAG